VLLVVAVGDAANAIWQSSVATSLAMRLLLPNAVDIAALEPDVVIV
jgi:hypothetical protein